MLAARLRCSATRSIDGSLATSARCGLPGRLKREAERRCAHKRPPQARAFLKPHRLPLSRTRCRSLPDARVRLRRLVSAVGALERSRHTQQGPGASAGIACAGREPSAWNLCGLRTRAVALHGREDRPQMIQQRRRHGIWFAQREVGDGERLAVPRDRNRPLA